MKKTILKGNEAIEAYEAYEELQGSYSTKNMPKICGYFATDDCEHTQHIWDKGTILAFDSTNGDNYEMTFSTVDEAIGWIEL